MLFTSDKQRYNDGVVVPRARDKSQHYDFLKLVYTVFHCHFISRSVFTMDLPFPIPTAYLQPFERQNAGDLEFSVPFINIVILQKCIFALYLPTEMP